MSQLKSQRRKKILNVCFLVNKDVLYCKYTRGRSFMKIDLHCHTTASDGIYSPSDVVRLSRQADVSHIAIADHDTLSGIEEAVQCGKSCNISVIPCMEFSVDHHGGDFHLLGYFVDHTNTALLTEVDRLRQTRELRIPLIVERLQAAGIDITAADVAVEAGGGAPGKPHVARALIKKGIVATFDDAFSRYLTHGAPGDVPKEKISAETAFESIQRAGGVAVCAHPVSLGYGKEELVSFIKKMISLGLAGIECYSNMHSDDDVSMYCDIARSFSLAITGGSDFHGDKAEHLGEYGSGRLIPASCVDELYSLKRTT
jgi:3',5'-nucleoside bisphosphate phosphatase